MVMVIITVRRRNKETPVIVFMPNTFTEEQLAQSIHLEGVTPEDGYTFTYQTVGMVDEELFDKFGVADFDPFFPDKWQGMY